MGGHDEADEFAQIVSVFGKADRQVIEQILVQGLGVHRIDRMIPRPIKRAQMRFTMVRVNRPFSDGSSDRPIA